MPKTGLDTDISQIKKIQFKEESPRNIAVKEKGLDYLLLKNTHNRWRKARYR